MAYQSTQRFISGLMVYDTYNGLNGVVTEMNLNLLATHPLSPPYVGPYFVVTFTDSSMQLFNLSGQRVFVDGTNLTGITLLTFTEITALLAVSYPASAG